jgi:integrase
LLTKKRGNNEGTIVKRADGRWMASMTLGRDPQSGKVKRASFYGTTRAAVATKLATALRDHHQGVFTPPQRLTVGHWLQIWLDDYKRPTVRPKTYESYASQLRLHLVPALGHVPLAELRPHQVQHFYNTLATQVSARTVRYNHSLLHDALSLAAKHQKVARDVTMLCTAPRLQTVERPTLTVPSVTTRLFPALVGERLQAAIVLACCTGMRRGELVGLRWADVDLPQARLQVRQTAVRLARAGAPGDGGRKTHIVFQDPKTPKSRRPLPLPALCVQALRAHRARQAQERLLWGGTYPDGELVFSQENGQPLEGKTLNRVLTRVLRRAGLPHVRLHDLRHTFATWLLEQGENPKTVSQLLGHTRVQITLDLYSHVTLAVEHQAIARLGETLEGRR